MMRVTILTTLLLVGCGNKSSDGDIDVATDETVDAPVDLTGDETPDVDPDTAPLDVVDTIDKEIVDVWTDVSVAVTDLAYTVNPRNVLSYYVTWSTSVDVITELQVDCGADYAHTFVGEVETTSHEVFVMGLIAGLSCTLTAYPGRDGISGETTALIPSVGPLPDHIPALTVDVADTSRMQPGWTMWSVSEVDVEGDVTIVVIDAQGRYRWYTNPGVDYEEPEAEVLPIDGGVLLGNLRTDSQITSWEGELIWSLDHRAHHDMQLSTFNADHVLFLGHGSETCPYGGTEHTAMEMDMATHSVVWSWWVCDYWTPRRDVTNWSHLNAIVPVPGERAVLISSRDQDVVFKVDRDTDELVWTLGIQGDFAMDAEDHFFRQHAPEIQPDGSILLFDNGISVAEASADGLAAREYSRVLQIELAFDASEDPDAAEVVWEYSDTDIFAKSRSEADRLANGNTLIHFCWTVPDHSTILREVTMAGEIVWNVVSPPQTASYRSERFDPYWGHVTVE